MPLDQLQAYLSIAKDVFTIFASLTAGIVAILGLRTWRKQLKGKTEYELARRLLTAVYKIRYAFYLVRNPFMSAGEISQSLKDANIQGNPADPKLHASSQHAVYQQRWTKMQEAWSTFDIALLEAESLWGNEITELSKLLNNLATTLHVNIQKSLRNLQDPREIDPAKIEEIDNIIYGHPNDEDKNEFSAEILDVIHAFEKYLKPKLKL